MNHKINRYLKKLPYDPGTVTGFPIASERYVNPPVCVDKCAYWGLIKLYKPQACRGIGFCLITEAAKYGVYGNES